MTEFELRFPENNNLSEDGWWTRIRIFRNELLAKSDWTILSDSPVDKTAWTNYRQQLRDLPTTVSDPSKIVFPNPPQE